MQSILSEITSLRNGVPISIDYQNSNRYRLVLEETNGSRTAYYFSCPIYNIQTRKMIDTKFHLDGGNIYVIGSNAKITIGQNILMKNTKDACVLELNQKPVFISEKQLNCGNDYIYPTTNGVAMKCNIKGAGKTEFIVEASSKFMKIRANDKYFAFMKERFRPMAVFSCIGAVGTTENLIAPAKMSYQKLTDKKYKLTISTASPLAKYVLFEANLYENKLIHDTTVESLNPTINNAFGSIGFIGNTAAYGEQWMYSRVDYTKTAEVMNKQINKVMLHIPKYNQGKVDISAFKVKTRFCSFGSNWNNKIAGETLINDSQLIKRYQSIDITSLTVDAITKTITRSDGLILKSKIKNSGFSAVATGDSCFAPQILEINYR